MNTNSKKRYTFLSFITKSVSSPVGLAKVNVYSLALKRHYKIFYGNFCPKAQELINAVRVP
jgi:hypothetical protein